MEQITTTPMLRQVRRTHSLTQKQSNQTADRQDLKDLRWHLLDLVKTCRRRLKLRDRDIAVLRGLLSLMPKEAAPHQMVIFASNRVLTERCDGIDERTLRRRIGHLQDVGLLARQSSPNGKRYQVRDEHSEARLTYGICLSPMFQIQSHLEALAEEHNRDAIRIAALKAMIRDALYRFPETPASNLRDEAKLALRRTISSDRLEEIVIQLQEALPKKPEQLSTEKPNSPAISSASNGQNDRHIHRSNKETYESEGDAMKVCDPTCRTTGSQFATMQDITVAECMELATTARAMCPAMPQCWEDVICLSTTLAPAIGLKRSSIETARERLGRHGCALAILGLVEAVDRIRSPEAYLCALSAKAQRKALDLVQMFRSLVRTPGYQR